MGNVKISKYHILFALLIVPFFKPVGIAYYPLINKIFQMWKLVSLCCSVIVIAYVSKLNISRSKSYVGLLGLIIFEIIYVINTVVASNPVGDILNNSVTNVVLLWLVYVLSCSQYKLHFLKAVNIVFSIDIWLHIFSVVLAAIGHPVFEVIEGGNTYLFGRDNYSAFTLLPMLGVVLYTDVILYGVCYRQRLNAYILCFALTFCFFYTNSATAMLAFFVETCLVIFTSIRKELMKFLTTKRIIILIGLFLIGIVVFHVQEHFAYFLSVAFNKGEKGITLNSRTIIWDMALDLIMQRPVFGWGALSQKQISNYVLYGVGHAHNIIFEILLRSGFVGLISYVWFLIWPYRDKFAILRSRANILLATLASYLFLTIMDFYPLLQAQYCMMGLIYCWKNFEQDI